jgi:hypothetical protein
VPSDLQVKAVVMEAEAEAVTVGDGIRGSRGEGGSGNGSKKDNGSNSHGGGIDND